MIGRRKYLFRGLSSEGVEEKKCAGRTGRGLPGRTRRKILDTQRRRGERSVINLGKHLRLLREESELSRKKHLEKMTIGKS